MALRILIQLANANYPIVPIPSAEEKLLAASYIAFGLILMFLADRIVRAIYKA